MDFRHDVLALRTGATRVGDFSTVLAESHRDAPSKTRLDWDRKLLGGSSVSSSESISSISKSPGMHLHDASKSAAVEQLEFIACVISLEEGMYALSTMILTFWRSMDFSLSS